MSTKSSIIWTTNDHIYEDTSESRYSLTTFVGNDITAEIDNNSFESFEITEGQLTVRLKGELKEILGEEFSFLGMDIKRVYYESGVHGYLGIEIIAGSFTAKKLQEKKMN